MYQTQFQYERTTTLNAVSPQVLRATIARNMEYVRKVAEEIIRDGLITRDFAEQQIVELQNQITKDNSQSQKQGDTSRLFLMNLFKQGKLTIKQLPTYAEKLQLMDNNPTATQPQPQSPPQHQRKPPPPPSGHVSVVSQSDARSSIKSPKLSKKFSLRHMRSITSMGSAECIPEYPGPSGMEKSPTSPGFKRRSKHKSEPTSIKTISRVQSRFFDPIPQPFGSNQATSQSNPIFKVYELQKDDGQRKMLQFVFSANVVQYIVRGKKPIEIPFEEISHHDVSEGQIIITTTTEQTYQLGLSDVSEQDKVQKCLSSIGHEDDLCLVEENVLIEGYLDKKGPHALGGTKKRFVKVTQGKLSYYKIDSSKSYEAPLNTIVLNPELNEIKRFGNEGFTIVPTNNKDEKEFSFMIQKGKLKVDDIIERREEWVASIKQAYEIGVFSSPLHPAVNRVGSTAKPIGTHLVNLAKQQLESMLEVLKEYEAEEECAAQANKMYQLLDDIERKLVTAVSANVSLPPPSHSYSPKLANIVSPSTDDISSQSSTNSNREESISSNYEDVEFQPCTPSYEKTPTAPLHRKSGNRQEIPSGTTGLRTPS
ncbi:uncharacterized protein LOC134823177 isoform X7 [Bolinopsis microptera]|uniref:uncharacterized protein LOC134823177 isoform X7 n=2 Tax=Bolinopsis microptera TaxID=2820187 RepID=UPI00307913A7